VVVDVVLDLLKRHLDIVWDPGRFAGLLRGGDVRRCGGGEAFLFISRSQTRESWRRRNKKFNHCRMI